MAGLCYLCPLQLIASCCVFRVHILHLGENQGFLLIAGMSSCLTHRNPTEEFISMPFYSFLGSQVMLFLLSFSAPCHLSNYSSVWNRIFLVEWHKKLYCLRRSHKSRLWNLISRQIVIPPSSRDDPPRADRLPSSPWVASTESLLFRSG